MYRSSRTSLTDATEIMEHQIFGSMPFPDRHIGFSSREIFHMRELFENRMALVFIARGSVNELCKTVEPFKSSGLSMYDDAGYMRLGTGDDAAWYLIGLCSHAIYQEKKEIFNLHRVVPLDLRVVAYAYKAMQATCRHFFGEELILTGSVHLLAVSHLGIPPPSVLIQLGTHKVRIETCCTSRMLPQGLVALGVRESFHGIS